MLMLAACGGREPTLEELIIGVQKGEIPHEQLRARVERDGLDPMRLVEAEKRTWRPCPPGSWEPFEERACSGKRSCRCDHGGRVVELTQESPFLDPFNGMKPSVDTTTYRYDAQGRLASVFTSGTAPGGGSVVQELSYDAQDRVLRVDTRADGRVIVAETRSYGEDGQLQTQRYDALADGIIGETVHHVYEGGRLVRSDSDLYQDGTMEEATHYVYDDDGKRVSSQRRSRGGVPLWTCHYEPPCAAPYRGCPIRCD